MQEKHPILHGPFLLWPIEIKNIGFKINHTGLMLLSRYLAKAKTFSLNINISPFSNIKFRLITP
jgi:hypothetical protein